MRKTSITRILFFAVLLFSGIGAHAQRFAGADLTYKHVSGSTYKIFVTLYVECGSGSHVTTSFMTDVTPKVCIYNGSTSFASISLSMDSSLSFREVNPLCTGDLSVCTSATSVIPGVEKFVYSDTFVLPTTSAAWRFIYTGNNGVGPSATRAPLITNIADAEIGLIQLIDTLNNLSSDNSNPDFSIPVPAFFLEVASQAYNPMASDPDGDSLSFSLGTAQLATEVCGTIGGAVTYMGTAWNPPLTPVSATTPLNVATGSFAFNSANGQISFFPNALQRSVVVYNIREYRSGVLVGTSQREMTFRIIATDPRSSVPCFGGVHAGTTILTGSCSGVADTLSMSGHPVSCGILFQWQYSSGSLWSNIVGATSAEYVLTSLATGYYRCALKCSVTGDIDHSTSLFIPGSIGHVLHSAVTTPMDTSCNGPQFYTYACGSSSSYHVTTFYGDATSDDHALSSATAYTVAYWHKYSTSGTYSIKEILYNGSSPVDSLIFSYEYQYCRTLPVKLYFDKNGDCIFDAGDSYLFTPMRIEVDSNSVAIDTISAVSGFYYRVYGPSGTIYSFKAVPATGSIISTCPLGGVLSDTISALVEDYPIKYIGFSCGAGTSYDLGEYNSILSASYKLGIFVIVNNSYCTPENGTFSVTLSPKYIYQTASPVPTSISGNTLTWAFDSLANTHPQHIVNVRATRVYSVLEGDTVNSFFSITPTTDDVDLSNNTTHRIDTVTRSFDPNEMSVAPSAYILAGTQLLYTIAFENTGNGPAQNIYVMDTLSDDVDPGSLRMKASSAVMNIATFNDGTHNIVKFDFPAINLLDSSHHGQCDGMVVFTINTRNGLPDGTLIDNRAGIYFDDNAVVMTNTVENIIGIATTDTATNVATTARNKVSIYPNPANETLTIRAAQGAYTTYTITNSVGQVLLQNELTNTRTTVDIRSLASGLYYITLRGTNGTVVQKFVKM